MPCGRAASLIIVGRVQFMHLPVRRGAVADEDEGAGLLAQHEREILAAGDRGGVGIDLRIADQCAGGGDHRFRLPPVIDERHGIPAQHLLRRRAGEVGRLREDPRGTEQHRRVPVMPAGMHAALIRGGIGQASALGQRECVHVGAQRDRPLPRPLAAQRPDHTEAADAFRHLDPPAAQLLRHQRSGARFLHAEFGMGVDVMADRGQRGEMARDARCGVVRGHEGGALLCSRMCCAKACRSAMGAAGALPPASRDAAPKRKAFRGFVVAAGGLEPPTPAL